MMATPVENVEALVVLRVTKADARAFHLFQTKRSQARRREIAEYAIINLLTGQIGTVIEMEDGRHVEPTRPLVPASPEG